MILQDIPSLQDLPKLLMASPKALVVRFKLFIGLDSPESDAVPGPLAIQQGWILMGGVSE
jgi:hypothetical protein